MREASTDGSGGGPGCRDNDGGGRGLTVADLAGPEGKVLSPREMELARMVLLNLAGAFAIGAREDLNPARTALLAALARSGESGPCRILTSHAFAGPQTASMINAATAMTAQADDFSNQARSHPGAVVVSAALACLDLAGGTGQDLLEAVVSGWDVAVRCGRLLRPDPARPLNFTSPVHAPAAAMAAARVLRLDRLRTLQALALACDAGTGLVAQSPRQAATLRTPIGAGLGVAAALAAEAGLAGREDILASWTQAYGANPEPPTPEALAADGLGQTGFLAKFSYFSTGASPSIRAMQALARDHAIASSDVVAIECRTSPGVLAVYGLTQPADGVEAHFALGRALALALVRGEAWSLADVVAVPHPDPEVERLQAVTRLVVSPAMAGKQSLSSGGDLGEVEVLLKDGRRLVAPGTPSRPLRGDPADWAPLEAALQRRLGMAFGQAEGDRRAVAIRAWVDRLPGVADAREFATLLAPA